MTAFKTATLNCDGQEGDHARDDMGIIVGAWIEQNTDSIPELRRFAKKAGWKSYMGRDYCPTHVEEAVAHA